MPLARCFREASRSEVCLWGQKEEESTYSHLTVGVIINEAFEGDEKGIRWSSVKPTE